MDLFEVINGVAMPSTHALLIEPFKTIWESDKTKEKGEAIKAFTLIELYCSKKKSNVFSGYSDEVRMQRIKENLYKDGSYEPKNQDLIREGMKVYMEFQYNASPTLSYLQVALNTADKLKEFLESVNLNEKTNGGAAVYKPADITRALKETPDVVKTLETLREKVSQELKEEVKTRNSREIGHFER